MKKKTFFLSPRLLLLHLVEQLSSRSAHSLEPRDKWVFFSLHPVFSEEVESGARRNFSDTKAAILEVDPRFEVGISRLVFNGTGRSSCGCIPIEFESFTT